MPRNKQTEAVELPDIEDLPTLSDAEREFVRLLLNEGLNATEAYRRTHKTEHLATSTVHWYAWKLRSSTKVQSWIKALVAAELHRGVLTQEEHVKELIALAERAESAGNYGAAVNARVNAGKAAGLYVERYENVTEKGRVSELLQAVRDMLGEQAYQQACRQLGVQESQRTH